MAVAGRGEVPQIVKNIGESVDVETSVEISQAQLVDKVVEVLVARCVQDLRRHAVGKTGEIAQVMTQKLSTAAVQTVARTMDGHTTGAVDQKGRRHLCRRAETDPSGSNDAEDHRDATVATHWNRRAIFLLSSLCRSHVRRSCRSQWPWHKPS